MYRINLRYKRLICLQTGFINHNLRNNTVGVLPVAVVRFTRTNWTAFDVVFFNNFPLTLMGNGKWRDTEEKRFGSSGGANENFFSIYFFVFFVLLCFSFVQDKLRINLKVICNFSFFAWFCDSVRFNVWYEHEHRQRNEASQSNIVQ